MTAPALPVERHQRAGLSLPRRVSHRPCGAPRRRFPVAAHQICQNMPKCRRSIYHEKDHHVLQSLKNHSPALVLAQVRAPALAPVRGMPRPPAFPLLSKFVFHLPSCVPRSRKYRAWRSMMQYLWGLYRRAYQSSLSHHPSGRPAVSRLSWRIYLRSYLAAGQTTPPKTTLCGMASDPGILDPHPKTIWVWR